MQILHYMDPLIVTSVNNVLFCERFTFCYSLHFTEFEMGRIETKPFNYRLKQVYKITKNICSMTDF